MATGLAIPADVATTIVSIIVISFAATTLDTSVRLMRYIIAKIAMKYNCGFTGRGGSLFPPSLVRNDRHTEPGVLLHIGTLPVSEVHPL